MLIFYSSSCHECMRVENDLMPAITEEFKGKLTIDYRNLADINNYKLMLGLSREQGIEAANTLPVFYINGRFLSKKALTSEEIRHFIKMSMSVPAGFPAEASQDLLARFKSFRPLAIIGAAAVDGINPCAFTVIVFFISFLALQGYRKKELLLVGFSFITAVFLTYLLLGVGILSFLYQIKGFWFVAKIFNYAVGSISLVLGALCIYDILKFKSSGKHEGMILQLPRQVKNQIHKVIGASYRKDGTVKKGVSSLVLSALFTGFIVSILEAVCTGQMYLPTIAFVLKTTHLRLEAFGYLVMYNIIFVMPLVVILLLGTWGVSSGEFSKFFNKHMGFVKMLMALAFFGLGLFLLWRN